ncbi:hypothetical protein CFC21_003066 [Triticum aestivum]|uniref:Nodulin-like domain-containing protein n=2 Tax=Triticum TaxID=4564 RepID=A0A9R0QFN9_TRITD|nr:protein NUCLEAR FUSION DEFECTIVE 4-like [Triticum aestivum]KAF6985170.1 hypothetical protein CFC21_003066 [Triticum aestivum]VAH08465.1 unnamed protein product [Triticum turgidum subsp. durum]
MPSSPTSVHWLSLVGSVWLQTINGPNSDFPVYSSELKTVKGISQVQLNFLAFASDAGKLFGWFAGVAALYVPLWLVAVVGAAFGLVGYGVQFLFLDSPRLAYWHLFALTSLAGNGICWINTVCYLLCINNFPSDSRVAVSLATSYLGLSAKFYTTMEDTLKGLRYSQAKKYLLLNAVVPMLVTLLVVPSLRVVKPGSGKRTDFGFFAMFAITLATGACAVVGSIGSKSLGVSSKEHLISLYVMLAVPILIPVALRVRESMAKIRAAANKRVHRVHDLGENGMCWLNKEIEVATNVKEEEEEVKEAGSVEHGGQEELGGLGLLRRLDFWMYFFSYMFSGTLGLVFLNNLGQIADSRGLGDPSTLVSLSSSFGFFGRLLPAFLDYYTAKSGYSISRTASMASLMAPMAGAFFLLMDPRDMLLYTSTAVIGTCTGAITSVAVSATSELFGTKNFGVNHNVLVANIPVGSLCFGYLAGFLYQREARGGNRCVGAACYRDTFLLWGLTCAVGTALCAALYARSGKRSGANKGPEVSGSAGV